MKKVRLEYNEKQRLFHLDNGSHDEFTFGWQTIYPDILEELANTFIEMAERIMEDQGQYSIDFVKHLFNRYIELVSNDIESAINKSAILN